ncbi:F390 synthetase-related protein [Ketogulonicigenium vulgare]|uniref:Putative adenylate-forming enzyme n=1 Tax=Ketogulonicigenium vulgare (strain WSH-001) TaxID=759362 RepID=F9YB89_KETVW|nr:F390 synthetase-related protein [Ketogulonicigenium vulgare]ADO44117.1 probable adenylate-forming enzyme [Ketogulonicigenium vulgare Y25]AEM42641.1 putative adenylate-forming enzyme [Ketogulonicigenium vulgare WSH-001]ALJ82447.1 adenylate synthase [Ketogulonicigenium vulgare]ANW35234.1 adenylate synthase [Ketogulonicigenium vulgare]AOZ53343.1 adenylate-forming enzyme [Ketogulonicigenium vulgare]
MTPAAAFAAIRWGRGFRTRAAVEAHQARGLARLRRDIMPRAPFYAPFADRPMDEWPLMSKPALMADFCTINTRGISLDQALETARRAEESRDFSPLIGDVAVGLSTGTSGQRGLFLTSPYERRLWAAVMCGRFWPRPLLARQRIAFFLRANNALYESLNNPLVRFAFFDLLAGVTDHLPRLAQTHPTVLIAPAQVLRHLALAQIRGDLNIAPQRIISVAEVLSPEDAALITTAFRRAPDQVYQCTEGVLAYTCPHGSLHLNERFVHFDRKVLDAATGAFSPIITDFTRESLPILRYALDDVLVPDPAPCACGCATTRIARIEGRCDDMLFWEGQGGRRMVPSDVIRQAVATAQVQVRDYRARQTGSHLLEIWLDTGDMRGATQQVSAALNQSAARLQARLPELRFHAGLPPPDGPKLRRVRAIS